MEKFDTYCRLCLSQSVPLISIFKSENNIPIQLTTCLSIEITTEDLLPKSICTKCSKTLHEFYMFYINSKCCEQWLLTCLSNEPSQLYKTKEVVDDGVENELQHSPNPEFLPEFLDMELLNSDSNTFTALEYLTNDEDETISVNHSNGGKKNSKVTNFKNKPPNSNISCDYYEIHMDIDVLDSDLDIVNEILAKQSSNSKIKNPSVCNESYSCLSCKAIFQNFEELAHHMGGCDALKRTCTCCGTLFESKESMLKHKNVRNELSTYTCEHCNKQFIGKERLNQHIEQAHSDFVTDSGFIYRCKHCGNIFQTRDGLYNHAKTHVKTKPTIKKLQKQSVNDKKDLLKTVQDNKTSSCVYRCKVCLKIYRDKDVLYKHVKQHTNILERTQHLCDSCGQSFNSYNTLSKHVLTHVGNQFQCMICLKPFINGSLLKKHLATHEIETQICELCGLIFSNDILLNMHKNDIHSVLF